MTSLSPFFNMFDHSPVGKVMSARLLTLKQGSRSTAEYALDYRTLAADSGWNDAALRAVYMKGVNDELIKELACREEAESLDNLISISIKLDNILRERE